MFEIHLESHRLPAGLVAQHTVRVADIAEHEHREHESNSGKGTDAFSRRLEVLPATPNHGQVHHYTHDQQDKCRENSVIAPVDIPTAGVRNRQIVENKERAHQNGKCDSQRNKMPAAVTQAFKNILHAGKYSKS